MDWALVSTSQRTLNTVKKYRKYLKIDWFGDKNRVTSNNLNATILKFSEKLDYPFSHAYNRHSNETVTHRKHVIKYKNMQKWTIEFIRKFENRGIKIVRGNSILITKSINLQLFTSILYGVGGPLWSKAIFRAQSIYREVYAMTHQVCVFFFLRELLSLWSTS